MTVEELVSSERFINNLAAYLVSQREDRKTAKASYLAMQKAGISKGFKLPAHPIDNVVNLTAEDFAVEYLSVVCKTSKRPFAERQYIEQLGQQAYNLTVSQIVIEEFPELEDILIPKHQTN